MWYYGIPKQVTLVDNFGNTNTQTIVTGQHASTLKQSIPASEIVQDAEGNDVEIPYYLDGYFSDSGCTKLISTNDIRVNQNRHKISS